MVEDDASRVRGASSDESDRSDGKPDVENILSETGFDADSNVLTRRQAEVLALRERGLKQAEVAGILETSRANVASVESSARNNVANARETVTFYEVLSAPVRVEIQPGTDLYDVPARVFEVCDEAGVKVNHTAPDLMKVINDAAIDAIQGRTVRQRLFVTVTREGTVEVRTP